MSEVKKRKVHGADFKAKVGLEAIRGLKTLNKIRQDYGVHPVQVGHWKKTILDQARSLFEGKRGPQPAAEVGDAEHLYSEIGRLKIELDWLKKVWLEPAAMRRAWITPLKALAVVRQCQLAGVSRATSYAQRHPKPVAAEDLLLLRLLDEE